MNPDEIRAAIESLGRRDLAGKEPLLRELLEDLEQIEALEKRQACQDDFMSFVRAVWPGFIDGSHLRIMAQAYQRLVDGDLKRLCINIAPRMGKSKMSSVMLPAYFMGKFPDKKVIQASHTAELAVGFSREVRNLVQSDDYQKIFPGTGLRADSKAAGRWTTNRGGEYFAIGVGGALAGKGADLCVIDDSCSEQEALSNSGEIFDMIYEWYLAGPRQRLQPNGRMCIVETRWSQRDLTARVLDAAKKRPGIEQWEHICFPAILPDGKALWPEYWPLHAMEALRSELPPYRWLAQYVQEPTSEIGSIVPRAWWQRWTQSKMPDCVFKILSIDTAYGDTKRANPSAFTTWGSFLQNPDDKNKKSCLILLDAFTERLSFPDLKRRTKEAYLKMRPDLVLVEDQATGAPLTAELRLAGIPVQSYRPTRADGNKVTRLNAVADLFKSGNIYAPETSWAEDVIEQMTQFPHGTHDDLVDCTTMALSRFRSGGMIRIEFDEEDEEPFKAPYGGYY